MHAPKGGEAFVLAETWREASFLLVVAHHDAEMEAMARAFAFFSPQATIMTIPAWDVIPYDYLSPAMARMGARIGAMQQLAQWDQSKQTICITTLNAMTQKMPSLDHVPSLHMRQGEDTIGYGGLLQWLEEAGYQHFETVYEIGGYARRGSIIDVFPPQSDHPVRVDFFGNQLESLRLFDVQNQKSTQSLSQITLGYVSEWRLNDQTTRSFKKHYHALPGGFPHKDPFYDAIHGGVKALGGEHHLPLFYDSLHSLLDDMPSDAIIMLPHEWRDLMKIRDETITQSFEARIEELQSHDANAQKDDMAPRRVIEPDGLYINGEMWEKNLQRYQHVYDYSSIGGDVKKKGVRSLILPKDSFSRQWAFIEKKSQGRPILLAMTSEGSVRHIKTLLQGMGHETITQARDWSDIKDGGGGKAQLWAGLCPLTGSMESSDGLIVTEQDLFGMRGMRRSSSVRRRRPSMGGELNSFRQGSLVVHEEHGVGRYEGLRRLQIDEAPHDCIQLVYKGDDELLIPVEHIGLLTSYGSQQATLDQLGSAFWQKRKAAAKERVGELAHRLADLAAKRRQTKAPSLHCNDIAYDEFCARFPYEPTEDQEAVVRECEADLERSHPTDRLICGDTGFGKTEVALRASFVAFHSGSQVMVLAPTTLLARQHYELFKKRFESFDCTIAHISRHVGDAQKSLESLAAGDVDIAIGTHRLLKARPPKLGLLIVDEEQHFGVSQKERIKELASHVHVMTLTATPIPRTLHMAMSGLRDMSVIETPPPGRLAVRTFVLPYDSIVVRDALLREKKRGGRSYYIVPRIQDMEEVRERLAALVPQLRVVMAHGRMAAGEMDKSVSAFYGGQADILLATAIVEAGLDVPQANSIIIHRSDRFGLAQLYQMRGRVGRSTLRGWAYLTLPQGISLKAKAQKRLEILHGLDELGAGLTIATHDRDIRGAGNLLGAEQSGHIKEVGIELFEHMLRQATARMTQSKDEQQKTEDKPSPPRLHLGIPMLIPESYISNLSLRLRFYRRLGASDAAELSVMGEELEDRFGSMPRECHLLLAAFAVRLKGWELGLESVTVGVQGVMFAFHQHHPKNPEALIAWVQKNKDHVKLRPPQSVLMMGEWQKEEERLQFIDDTLIALQQLLLKMN